MLMARRTASKPCDSRIFELKSLRKSLWVAEPKILKREAEAKLNEDMDEPGPDGARSILMCWIRWAIR